MIELKWLQKFYDDVFWLTFIQAFKSKEKVRINFLKKEGLSNVKGRESSFFTNQ